MGCRKKKVTIHDRITNAVFDRMRGNGYGIIAKNRCYNSSLGDGEGEFDVLAVKANNDSIKYAVIVEVKTSKHGRSIKKARSQLERGCRKVKELYGKRTRCFKMFVYGNKGKLNYKLDRPYSVEWLR
tara:strand:+ start:2795 stop:3175 length:381 start_codon:yes stop_codon:yes gene_type:complete